jgi:hypothetical protein
VKRSKVTTKRRSSPQKKQEIVEQEIHYGDRFVTAAVLPLLRFDRLIFRGNMPPAAAMNISEAPPHCGAVVKRSVLNIPIVYDPDSSGNNESRRPKRLMDVIRRLQNKAIDCQTVIMDHFTTAVKPPKLTTPTQSSYAVKTSFKRRRSSRGAKNMKLLKAQQTRDMGLIIQRSADFQAIRQRYQKAIDQNGPATIEPPAVYSTSTVSRKSEKLVDKSCDHELGYKSLRARLFKDPGEFWRNRMEDLQENWKKAEEELAPKLVAQISIRPPDSNDKDENGSSLGSDLSSDDGVELEPRTALWRRRYVERIADPTQKSKLIPSRFRGRPVIAWTGADLAKKLANLYPPTPDDQLPVNDRRESTQSAASNNSDSSGYSSAVEISPSNRLQNLMQRATPIPVAAPRPPWKLKFLKFMGNQVRNKCLFQQDLANLVNLQTCL